MHKPALKRRKKRIARIGRVIASAAAGKPWATRRVLVDFARHLEKAEAAA